MPMPDERRKYIRYIRHDKLFVQILAASEAVDISDKTVFCRSCDASINGLKIELSQDIPIHSLVDLWVGFEGLAQKFYLRGHVCWCYELAGENDSYQIGIELEDAFASDYKSWIELLSSFED